MSDEPKVLEPQDRERINLHDEQELRYWTEKLSATELELAVAVEAVGDKAKDVAAHLNRPFY